MTQYKLRAWFFIALTLSQETVVNAGFGPTPSPPAYDPSKPRAGEYVANCAVDVGIATIFLGKAGLGINAAVETCTKNPLYSNRRRHWPNRRRATTISPVEAAACSASASGAISAFFFAGSFAALAASDCEKSLDKTNEVLARNARCVADFSFVLAGMTLVAQAGSEIFRTCPSLLDQTIRNQWAKYWDKSFNGDSAISDDSVRRLSELQEKLGNKDLYEQDGVTLNETKVAAVLDAASEKLSRFVPEAANFKQQHAEALEARRLKASGLLSLLAPAPTPKPTPQPTTGKLFKVVTAARIRKAEEAECAFDIGQATFFMARAALMVNAAVQDCSSAHLFEGGDKTRSVCSVDITSLIAAFSFVASGISFSVFQCPAWKMGTQAACAGAIINIVAALAEIAAAGSDFEQSCSKLPEKEEKKGLRRLNEANGTVV